MVGATNSKKKLTFRKILIWNDFQNQKLELSDKHVTNFYHRVFINHHGDYMKSNKEIWNEALDQLVPFTELRPYTGLGDSSVERKIRNFTFPQPVRISSGKRSFRLKDLKEWQKDPSSYSSKSE